MSKVEAVREILTKHMPRDCELSIKHHVAAIEDLTDRIDALYREGCPKGCEGFAQRLAAQQVDNEFPTCPIIETPAEQDTQKCGTCDGTGGVFYTDGSGDYDCAEKPTPCPDCNGTGEG